MAGMPALGGCASGAGAGSGATEPRSRIPPALAAQRRGITRYRRNGAGAEWRTPQGLAQ